jgi:hypothetical protein
VTPAGPVAPVAPTGPVAPVGPVAPIGPVGPTIPVEIIATISAWLFAKLVVPVPPDDVRVTGTSIYPVSIVGVADTVNF